MSQAPLDGSHTAMMRALSFRVQNFRNIDDSGWIQLDRVTALVGRNESGKTALLKALHKFNPALREPYDAQREFPRDRYTSFDDARKWPACSVTFRLSAELEEELSRIADDGVERGTVTCTRYYDGSLLTELDPGVTDPVLDLTTARDALRALAASARRIASPSADQEEAIAKLRATLANWADTWEQRVAALDPGDRGAAATELRSLLEESNRHAGPATADMIEELQGVVRAVAEAAGAPLRSQRARQLIEQHLPVFIYFENYGILDSSIHLPSFVEHLAREPGDPRVRTVNAVFRHVSLDPSEILALGAESIQQARAMGLEAADAIGRDQDRKEARAIKLNAASIDITRRFNEWYKQRRYVLEYQADGEYFRIWVSDDRRPQVKIELEARSKGFQWFFSFYLVFLVESDDGHRDAVLLLDEPGMHLHPTAQQDLIAFFETLAESNQLLYTTHSPFLVDAEHLHRARPVAEDSTGHSTVHEGVWPSDREAIFPLQAAAGYAMARGLFQHGKHVLVEGMSDYYYLSALTEQCRSTGRSSLASDVQVTPCGDTRLVAPLASLFRGEDVHPLVLLDGNDAGRARRDGLLREMYAEHPGAVLLLDDVVGSPGQDVEIEDLLGESVLLPIVGSIVGTSISLSDADRSAGSLPSQIEAWASREGVDLPGGWKAAVARALVSGWARTGWYAPGEVLDRAAGLFRVITDRLS